MQMNVPEGTKITMNMKVENDTQIKHITMNGNDATLVNYDTRLNTIIWDNGHMNYKIDGTVDEKTLIKIAESLE